MPLENMSRNPEQAFFADGITEDIITALSRLRWLFVIDRNTSFSYKGQTYDTAQVGRALSIRYVLEGSVRQAGGQIRVTAQIVDAPMLNNFGRNGLTGIWMRSSICKTS